MMSITRVIDERAGRGIGSWWAGDFPVPGIGSWWVGDFPPPIGPISLEIECPLRAFDSVADQSANVDRVLAGVVDPVADEAVDKSI